MSAAEKLEALERRKALVRARIAERRAHCVAAAAEVARPLALVDRGIDMWRSTPQPVKLVAIPTALFVARKLGRTFGPVAAVTKYVPLALQGWRMFSQMRSSRAGRGAGAGPGAAESPPGGV